MGAFMGIKKFQPKISITPQILKLITEIDEFKGQWTTLKQLSPTQLQSLKTVATIESIGSSTRIEGAKLTDQEIEKLLKGLEIKSFRTRDEEEVRGYAEVIHTIIESYEHIPLTESYLKQLHGILLKFSSKDVRHRGEYKKFPNHVEAFDQNGKSIGVIFKTVSPFETPQRMQELFEWINRSFEEKLLHPLLVIAVFIVNFLAIHPFQDGNGRISRILTSLLLLKHGYHYVPFSSLEHIIEENKENYYLALHNSQKELGNENENLESWLLFFINSLKAQKDVLLKKIEQEKIFLKTPLLSQQILTLVKEHGRITNAAIQNFTNANRNTIKVHLQKLVSDGILIQHGKGKGSWYSLA